MLSHIFQKETPDIFNPESGFEARYERVTSFYDVKNASSFGFNLWELLGISAY